MKRVQVKLWQLIAILLFINFGIRLLVYYKTTLFSFGDWSAYLGAIDNISRGEKQYLLVGNFLFAISYMGYFAKEVLGSLDWFFILNSLLGTLSGLLIYKMLTRITGSSKAGLIALVLLTVYTEFMVFSSIFYTPVIMIFLLSLFISLFYYFIQSDSRVTIVSTAAGLTVIHFLTFFFKPELKYFPVLLFGVGIALRIHNEKTWLRVLVLALLLAPSSFLLDRGGILTAPPGNTISNEFVFFGHTGYGGDGGEGSFVYSENRIRYEEACSNYMKEKGIASPTTSDLNRFRSDEIKKFISSHPMQWIKLQAKKFFREFGVVPETNSFKVLYTGPMKGWFWPTVFVVVLPVPLILLLFILSFDVKKFISIFNPSASLNDRTRVFLLIYLLIFIYYIIACVFYGHYQERYRLPVFVLFVIPMLSYFLTSCTWVKLTWSKSLFARILILFLFLAIWTAQTRSALSNKERLKNAIESIQQKNR